PPAPRRAHRFRVGPVGSDGMGPPPEAQPDGPTVLDTMIAAMVGRGPAAHRVWLPPLDAAPPLDRLLGMPTVRPGRGLAAPLSGGTLQVPVGVLDRPLLQRREPLTIDLATAAGHLAVVGGPRAGKSGAVRTVVLALALTHRPDELGVHVIDFGGGGLSVLAGLPHVGTVTDRQHPDVVRRVVAEAAAVLDRRERLFRAAGVGSVEEFRARRAAGEFPAEAATDVLLVIDGYLVLRGEFDDLEARVLPLAAQGLSYGLHLVITASRWSELRHALKDALGSRLELRLGEPAESEVDRRRASAVPARPGHGLAADGAPMVLAAPWLSTGGTEAVGGGDTGGDTGGLVAAVADAWTGPSFAPVAMLPDLVHLDDVPAVAVGGAGPGRGGIAIGLDEEGLAPVLVDLGADPHLVCFADAESGKTTLLRVVAHGLAARYGPDELRIVVVDYRRGLLGAVPASHLLAYASTADAAAEAAHDIAASLRGRLPGPTVGPRELRERSWWSGPEVVVLVDDYDLVAPGGATVHPLLPLLEFLPQAKDVGLHVVVTRRCGGAARALFDPLLGRLRELAVPGLVMNGSPDEGALVGSVRPQPLPPGRGTLVDRRRGNRRVQLAWLPPAPDTEPGQAGP
ncbi:MAG TPA: type VII secretion protein EccCb, partial [Pseudonocardia sp.]|nr:type VII secretion protein EccCb [Pseudonocardia sp.]